MQDQHDIWDELELNSAPESLVEEMFYLISAYADGECSWKERRLVEAYVAEQRGAREMLSEIRSQTALIGSERCEAPDWLRDAILNSTTRRPRLLKRVVFSRPVAFAVAASALLAAGLLLWPTRKTVEIGPIGEVVAVTDSRPKQPDFSPRYTGGTVNSHSTELTVVSDADTRPRRPLTTASRLRQASPVASSGGSPSGAARPEPRNGHAASSTTSSTAPGVRMGPEAGPVPRAVPEQPDVVALAGMSSEGEESLVESRQPESKTVETGKDPREGLRKRLRAVNQDSDVQDAFKGGK